MGWHAELRGRKTLGMWYGGWGWALPSCRCWCVFPTGKGECRGRAGLAYLWAPRWCNCAGSRPCWCRWGMSLPDETPHSLSHKLEGCCIPPLSSSGSFWSQKVSSSARRSQSLAKSDLRWRQLPFKFKNWRLGFVPLIHPKTPFTHNRIYSRGVSSLVQTQSQSTKLPQSLLFSLLVALPSAAAA